MIGHAEAGFGGRELLEDRPREIDDTGPVRERQAHVASHEPRDLVVVLGLRAKGRLQAPKRLRDHQALGDEGLAQRIVAALVDVEVAEHDDASDLPVAHACPLAQLGRRERGKRLELRKPLRRDLAETDVRRHQ
jgi:hypothetical protein